MGDLLHDRQQQIMEESGEDVDGGLKGEVCSAEQSLQRAKMRLYDQELKYKQAKQLKEASATRLEDLRQELTQVLQRISLDICMPCL